MNEILGNNLEHFFEYLDKYGVESNLTYKGERYEVWEVDDDLFPEMYDMSEEEFVELAGEDAWWRQSDGSVLDTPDTKVYINGHEMLGWAGELLEDEEYEEFEIHASNLSNYLCDVVGASQPKNVCALAVDLAKYNNMTMGELFAKYEG